MTDREKILSYLDELHERSGGHNGVYIRAIEKLLNKPEEQFTQILNQLFIEGLIKCPNGMNGKLIMKK